MSLEALKEQDVPWRTGRVLAYTYDPGEETADVVHKVYRSFLTENALDPTTFPSTKQQETDIIHMLRDLLRGDDAVLGNCTFGGTESIMCAVKTARDWARANRPEIEVPEMIVSTTAHAAFHKAALYLGIKLVMVGFDGETFQSDVDAMSGRSPPIQF